MVKEEIYKRFETFENFGDKFEKRIRSLELGRERSAENDEIEIQEVNKTASFYIKIKQIDQTKCIGKHAYSHHFFLRAIMNI